MRLALPLQTLLPAVGFVPRAPVPLPTLLWLSLSNLRQNQRWR